MLEFSMQEILEDLDEVDFGVAHGRPFAIQLHPLSEKRFHRN